MRATDLPFNKSVKLPSAVEEEDEVAMQELKNRLYNVALQYTKTNRRPEDNLNAAERKGMDSLQRRVNTGNAVIFQTDKSGRFSMDTPDNYKEACKPHLQNDEPVTLKHHDQIEKQLCAHAVMWSRMLDSGAAINQTTRIKNNMISKTSHIAPLYGIRKDHKPSTDIKGPPVRPVCGANDSLNMKLSHVLTTLLDPVWKSPTNVTDGFTTGVGINNKL